MRTIALILLILGVLGNKSISFEVFGFRKIQESGIEKIINPYNAYPPVFIDVNNDSRKDKVIHYSSDNENNCLVFYINEGKKFVRRAVIQHILYDDPILTFDSKDNSLIMYQSSHNYGCYFHRIKYINNTWYITSEKYYRYIEKKGKRDSVLLFDEKLSNVNLLTYKLPRDKVMKKLKQMDLYHPKAQVKVSKALIYKKINEPSRAYLVKGDIVTILKEESDWYKIRFEGIKATTEGWIKKRALD